MMRDKKKKTQIVNNSVIGNNQGSDWKSYFTGFWK
jgi:hypothetical protein